MKKFVSVFTVLVICFFSSVTYAGFFDRNEPPAFWNKLEICYTFDNETVYGVYIKENEDSDLYFIKFGEFVDAIIERVEGNTDDGIYANVYWKELTEKKWVMKVDIVDKVKEYNTTIKILFKRIKFENGKYGILFDRFIGDNGIEMSSKFIEDFMYKVANYMERNDKWGE